MDTTDIKKLERRIVRIYEDRYFSNDLLVEERAKECIDSLLNQRWHMMHSSIVWDDDFIARLSAMNEKMKQAVLEMRRLTLDTFEHLMASCPKDKEIETTGTLWVDDMDMEGWKHGSHMWGYLSEILQTPELGWANLYKYGVTREVVYCSDETSWHTNADNTELEVLYQMSGQLDNWNEFMDILAPYMTSILDGSLSTEDGLNQAQAELETLMGL